MVFEFITGDWRQPTFESLFSEWWMFVSPMVDLSIISPMVDSIVAAKAVNQYKFIIGSEKSGVYCLLFNV